MPDSKLSYTPALGVDEPPSKRCSNHVFWADAGKYTKHSGNIDISTRPWIFQQGDNWEGSLSPSENLSATRDSHNVLAEYQPRDCFSIRGYSSPTDNLNDYASQYAANCLPVHGWSDQDSVMGLWGKDMTTSHNYSDCIPYLFNESIAGEIQTEPTENYNNIPAISIPSAAAAADVQEMLPATIPYPTTVSCDFCTPPFQKLPDNFRLTVVEGGITANLMSDVSYPRSTSAEQENMEKGIKPTASTTQRQHIGQVEQIDELWRDRNHIDEAVHGLGKLEDRLQGWNKHQMDAVQETSNATRESTIRKVENSKLYSVG
uniref:Uncharacterized protein n=1 Tax=Bionectria ochroleuca TaxID=29856 RepID=A0A8H7K505_BIOOC